MASMDEDTLLSHLQTLELDSSSFVTGTLAQSREIALRSYHRMPYGNEEEGWSTIVTSEVQDAVEWALPGLLEIFTSTDKAVSFDPSKAEDVAGAEQATDACNYVFYKQNNGFLVLYTALKDALIEKNCAVMWRKETKRVKNVTPVTHASPEMLAMLLSDKDEEDGEKDGDDAPKIESGSYETVMAPDQMTGQPVPTQLFTGRISKVEKKTTIKVEAFPPEDLRVRRDWTSPLLDECPYVARSMRVMLTDIHEMGFTDVEPEDLAGSDDSASRTGETIRAARSGSLSDPNARAMQSGTDDESLTEGYLRIEYVLVDFDGDGIAERRCIYRLQNKILRNEECDHVPIATASPILNPHRWDGMSLADAMMDLQELGTELTRQMLNSAYLSNNPRTKVLTDANWSPLANVDDLLDARPGAILRQRQVDAIQEHSTPWSGGQMFPMLDHVQRMGERRTGVSAMNQTDPNAIKQDKTAKEVQVTANALAARQKLTARIFAEVLLKPMFRGILKLLTDGEMEKIAFKLRDKFVEFNPNEWRDSYDMTVHVGLGTGDREVQGALLQNIFQQQGAIGASPLGSLLVKPKNIYHTLSKIVENAGFKNVADFYQDPGDQPIPQPGPPPEIALKQAEMQADAQKFQAETQRIQETEQLKAQAKLQEVRANLELQAANDQRDAERELRKAQYDSQLEQQRMALEDQRHQREMAFEQWKVEFEGAIKIEAANISSKAKLEDAATEAATSEAVQGMNT